MHVSVNKDKRLVCITFYVMSIAETLWSFISKKHLLTLWLFTYQVWIILWKNVNYLLTD